MGKRVDQAATQRASESLIRLVVRGKARLARFLRPGSTVLLIAVTVTGVGVVLKELGIPDSGYWRTRGPWSISLGVLASACYLGYALVVIGYRRTLKRSDQDTRLYAICRDVAMLFESEGRFDRSKIGVHVWAVSGLPGIRRLERRATFLFVERSPTSITWSKGKGVLGRTWERDEWILADLEPLGHAKNEEEYYAIPKEDRFSFSWHEAKATSQYMAALVWPLHGGPENAPHVIGCLSVDVQEEGAVDALGAVWVDKRQDIDAHIATCQAILG